MPLTPEQRRKYDFDWQIMDVIVGGKSAIDSAQGLMLRSQDDVYKFLECYGYDLDNPIEKAELFGNFQEAIGFMRKYFLKPENPDGLEIEIPRKILEITDISQLLLMAGEYNPGSDLHYGSTALWACALVKIMHTIAHMDKDMGSNYFSDVLKQILDRFYKFVHRDENGNVYLGKDARDPERIPLVAFESKPRKSRESVILKLLHKPENVAEEIFDRVGLRFVTHTKLDALRVVKFLKDRYVIMPGNIKPSRSRNTLFDENHFRNVLQELLQKVAKDEISVDELESRLIEATEVSQEKSEAKDNPYSSKYYKSIQFTGRQLVKFRNPVHDELMSLKAAVKGKTLPEDVSRVVERLDLVNVLREVRFFYPYEVQVCDEKSHTENLQGKSSHGSYKKNQIRAAMVRVMQPLIELTKDVNAQN